MRGWIFGIVATLLTVSAPAAHADWLWHYGAVACEGDAAMVRFAPTYNEDFPEFAPPPAQFESLFRNARVEDPSQCRLRDGRLVRLHHADEMDGRPYGSFGGISTQWFTLSIGDRTIYEREVFQSRDFDSDDIVIVYDGERLFQCRSREGDRLHSEDIPQRCTDASARLPGTAGATAPTRLRLRVLDASAQYRTLCSTLLQPSPFNYTPPHPWPAFVPLEPNEIIRIPDELGVSEDRFDLDNDGTVDTPIRIEGESNVFDGQFWALPPPGQSPSQADVNAMTLSVEAGSGNQARGAGWRIYAGDQTAFDDVNYVRLEPLAYGGRTFLVATPRARRVRGGALVAPHSDGTLETVCRYEVAP